jgi:hypothetical protein
MSNWNDSGVSTPRLGFRREAEKYADLLHAGIEIFNMTPSPNLTKDDIAQLNQIKKLRKFVRENPLPHMSADEHYDYIASNNSRMTSVTGSPALGPYSAESAFPGSEFKTEPTKYSKRSPNYSKKNLTDVQISTMLKKEAEENKPYFWTTSGKLEANNREPARRNSSRANFGILPWRPLPNQANDPEGFRTVALERLEQRLKFVGTGANKSRKGRKNRKNRKNTRRN